jgi:DNA-directed RNA polymerase subunit K/omega
MKKQFTSRGPTLDVNKAVEMSGGNRFDLVIMAAARAREIRRLNKSSERFEHIHPNMTALLEFQDGKLDKEYLKRVK